MPQSTKVTRRGHHEGTIRKRPDGRWEARLSLPNGKRKSLYGQTRREVQDKIRSARRDAEQGLDLSAPSQTVGQFLDRWLADVVRVHLAPTLGHVHLAQFTAQHVQRLLQDKLASGLSPRTVAYVRTVLRIALNRGLKWGLVARNVAALTDPPRVTRTERTPLTPDQARQFLAAVAGSRDEALYRVALALGLRLGEALGLSWADVDLDTGTLRVRHALQRYRWQADAEDPEDGALAPHPEHAGLARHRHAIAQGPPA